MANINRLLREMKEAAKTTGKPSVEKTAGAITRAISKKIIRDLKPESMKDLKDKRRLTKVVNDMENPGDKALPEPLDTYHVLGATGIDGDGYALAAEEVALGERLAKGGQTEQEIIAAVEEAAFHLLKQGVSLRETTQRIYNTVSENYELSYYELGEAIVEIEMDMEHFGVLIESKKKDQKKEKKTCGACGDKNSSCSCRTFSSMMSDASAVADRFALEDDAAEADGE